MKIPYASAIGNLMYAIVCTRPDIGYAIGFVTQFMSNPGREHRATIKWILWYLKGTSSVCLRFGSGKPLFEGFTNSDMSADIDISWSTSRYVMTYAGGAISWQSRLQKSVALSTTKEEYMVVVETGNKVIWMKDFIGEVGI